VLRYSTLPILLTSVRDRSEWSLSPFGPFNTEEEVIDNHWIGGWMGPRTSLDALQKRKIPASAVNRSFVLLAELPRVMQLQYKHLLVWKCFCYSNKLLVRGSEILSYDTKLVMVI
jgi:hypothetical protein